MATINSEEPKANEAVDDSQVNKKLKSGSPLNLLLIFLILGMALYGGFLGFDKSRVLERTAELEEETQSIQAQIGTFREDKVEVSQNASDALKEIAAEEIRWSEVIAEVDKLIPQTASGEKLVNVLSYSGSGQGRIALNMVTRPEALPPYDDVASLIATFNNNVFFKNAYVPAISKSSLEGTGITLSFVLNMDYEKPETGSEDFASLKLPEVEEAVRVPVSRTTTDVEITPEVVEPAVVPVVSSGDSLETSDTTEAPKIPRNN